MERFVIYNVDTGLIDGGSGIYDQKKDNAAHLCGDFSTTTAYIARILARDSIVKRAVAIFDADAFDPARHKVVDGKPALMTKEEIDHAIDLFESLNAPNGPTLIDGWRCPNCGAGLSPEVKKCDCV